MINTNIIYGVLYDAYIYAVALRSAHMQYIHSVLRLHTHTHTHTRVVKCGKLHVLNALFSLYACPPLYKYILISVVWLLFVLSLVWQIADVDIGYRPIQNGNNKRLHFLLISYNDGARTRWIRDK